MSYTVVYYTGCSTAKNIYRFIIMFKITFIAAKYTFLNELNFYCQNLTLAVILSYSKPNST